MIKILLLTIVSAISLSAAAHPVSYEGALGLMSYNQEKDNEILLTYSFKSYIAAAANFYKFDTIEATIPRLNFLAKRWNNDDSQGNIYVSGGYGLEKSFNESKGIGLAQLEADWESRKYYISGQYTYFFREDSDLVKRDDFKHSKFRAGVAPYLADFNDLNSWLIVQFDKKNDEDIQTTQFVRLFYRNMLVELGATFGGGWAFNYMVHF